MDSLFQGAQGLWDTLIGPGWEEGTRSVTTPDEDKWETQSLLLLQSKGSRLAPDCPCQVSGRDIGKGPRASGATQKILRNSSGEAQHRCPRSRTNGWRQDSPFLCLRLGWVLPKIPTRESPSLPSFCEGDVKFSVTPSFQDGV